MVGNLETKMANYLADCLDEKKVAKTVTSRASKKVFSKVAELVELTVDGLVFRMAELKERLALCLAVLKEL